MPNRPPKACLKCGQPTDGKTYYCPTHHKEYLKRREPLTASERGYDAEWHAFSRAYLQIHPWCKGCGKRAKLVHHKQKVKDRPDLKYALGNLEPVCIACHGLRHSKEA